MFGKWPTRSLVSARTTGPSGQRKARSSNRMVFIGGAKVNGQRERLTTRNRNENRFTFFQLKPFQSAEAIHLTQELSHRRHRFNVFAENLERRQDWHRQDHPGNPPHPPPESEGDQDENRV